MRRKSNIIRNASLALLALGLLVPARAGAVPCAQVFERLYPANGAPTVRKVKGEGENDITYGLEGEVSVQNAPKLLDWYRPSNKTDAEWLALSHEERKSIAGNKPYGYVKTANAPEWLLEKLSSDPGGSEFMTRPTNKLEEALGWIQTVEQHLGQGAHGLGHVYWQGNVAYKRGGSFSASNRDGLAGYIKASADYAQFGKLHRGYKIHRSNPRYAPGKNLEHANLGPLNQSYMDKMNTELEAASNNRANSAYGHYIQGTFFRTWAYGPDRNGFEIRDAHKEVKVLNRELRRLTHGLQRGFGGYASFKGLTMTKETEHFNQMSEAVRNMLNQVSRYGKRYALPMRPLEQEYPQALGLTGEKARQFTQRVTNARSAYLRTLETIAASSAEKKEKLHKVRVALGKFAHDSGIYTALDAHFAAIGGGR